MNGNPRRFNNFNNKQRRGPKRPRRFNNINSIKTIAATTRQQQPRRFKPKSNTRPSYRQQARPQKPRSYRQTGKGKRFHPKQINSVNDNHQKQLAEANAAAKAMRLTGCVGCMALGHAYEIYFRSCEAACPFCHKEFKKNESRHFAVKCNKMPSTRQECIQVLRNNQKRR